jgi:GTP-binding protein HflX
MILANKKVVMIHCQNEAEDYTQYAVDEGKSLIQTVNSEVVYVFVFHVRTISPSTYIHSGQLEKVKLFLADNKVDFVFWNHILNHRNHRNLESALKIEVCDRTRVILEIFRARAHSAEEKLQVELAYKEYERSKVVHAWSHLERQRGHTSSTGGPGEKQLELDKRMIDNKIKVYKKKLEKVYLDRAIQRKSRMDVPLIAIVGYTNVGKTTLFNRLTHSHDYAEDKLFATLAPHVRRVFLQGSDPARNASILFSDTVGFIRNFPTSLRNAFAATLEEIKYADLILHVRDKQMPLEARYADRIIETLHEIGVDNTPIWNVWNKCDLETKIDTQNASEIESDTEQDAHNNVELDMENHVDDGDNKPVFHISAKTGQGVQDLKDKVMQFFLTKIHTNLTLVE